MLLTTLYALWASAAVASAARLTISVGASPQLPNPASLSASTHAVLLGPPGVRYDVPLRRDNTFLFPDIDSASYLLTVHSRDHQFPPLRIDVEKTEDAASQQTIEAWQTFRGNEWSNKGPSYGSAQNVAKFEVRPYAQKEFYVERGGFNLLSFLKSPMILMSLVSVVMIFGLPKMMENSEWHTCRVQELKGFVLTRYSGPGDEGRDGADDFKQRTPYRRRPSCKHKCVAPLLQVSNNHTNQHLLQFRTRSRTSTLLAGWQARPTVAEARKDELSNSTRS